MTELTENLTEWSRTFRRVGSTGVANLIDKAVAALSEGRMDGQLAVELQACAASRDDIPEQQVVAALMRNASNLLLPSHDMVEKG